jgi:hypothetical protein
MNHPRQAEMQHSLRFSGQELDLIKHTLRKAPEGTEAEAQRIIAKIERAVQ